MQVPLARSKRLALEEALATGEDIAVVINPAHRGVKLPESLMNEPRLILEYGYYMALPIPDLKVTAYGIRATLSFGRQPHPTFVPWGAVEGLRSKSGTVSYIFTEPTTQPPKPPSEEWRKFDEVHSGFKTAKRARRAPAKPKRPQLALVPEDAEPGPDDPPGPTYIGPPNLYVVR